MATKQMVRRVHPVGPGTHFPMMSIVRSGNRKSFVKNEDHKTAKQGSLV
jgi:hypothetical protein